ncbi:MAG: hypothetical protein JWN36_555 [Microbacteriaceae bacterium]|nr:hypothetical protein [Microbacteriaceae bacterium]
MTTTPQPPQHSSWRRAIAMGIGLAAVIGIIVIAFSWPAVTSSVKDLPVAIVGPDALTSQVEKAVDAKAPGTLKFEDAADRAHAVTLIKHRSVYGAIVLGTQPEVLTSSAASTVSNQLLTGIAGELQGQLSAASAAQAAATHTAPVPVTVKLTDVVPLSSSDPRGAGLTAAAFPLVLGGILGGSLITVVAVGTWRRVTALLVYSVAAGAGLAGILQGWFGVLQGDYFANAGVIGLTLLGIGSIIVGFSSIVGRVGAAIGPVLFLLIANPISSATAPLELLPKPWGLVGQWFPPGAGSTLLRDVSYFPHAAMGFPWLVLGGWAVVGLALSIVGHLRTQVVARTLQEPDPAIALA